LKQIILKNQIPVSKMKERRSSFMNETLFHLFTQRLSLPAAGQLQRGIRRKSALILFIILRTAALFLRPHRRFVRLRELAPCFKRGLKVVFAQAC
jgi:hypothetical protein